MSRGMYNDVGSARIDGIKQLIEFRRFDQLHIRHLAGQRLIGQVLGLYDACHGLPGQAGAADFETKLSGF